MFTLAVPVDWKELIKSFDGALGHFFSCQQTPHRCFSFSRELQLIYWYTAVLPAGLSFSWAKQHVRLFTEGYGRKLTFRGHRSGRHTQLLHHKSTVLLTQTLFYL